MLRLPKMRKDISKAIFMLMVVNKIVSTNNRDFLYLCLPKTNNYHLKRLLSATVNLLSTNYCFPDAKS